MKLRRRGFALLAGTNIGKLTEKRQKREKCIRSMKATFARIRYMTRSFLKVKTTHIPVCVFYIQIDRTIYIRLGFVAKVDLNVIRY